MRISDWSSDVCSSDLAGQDQRGEEEQADHDACRRLVDDRREGHEGQTGPACGDLVDGDTLGLGHEAERREDPNAAEQPEAQIGRASCRESVGQYVWISGDAVALTKKKKTKKE